MIRYLGHYYHVELQRPPTWPESDECPAREMMQVNTYNILLEYASFDLAEIFVQRQPPVFPNEIERFWKALIEIAQTVGELHNLQVGESHYSGYERISWPLS